MPLSQKQKAHTPAHHKKLSGAHQRHTKSFIKTYWPYLPLFLFLGVGLAVLGALVIGPVGAVLGGVSATVATITIAL